MARRPIEDSSTRQVWGGKKACIAYVGTLVPCSALLVLVMKLWKANLVVPFGYLPGGDAISNQALAMRDHLRQLGYHSKIFVRHLDPRMAHEAQIFTPCSVAAQAGIIYHHSIGSDLTSYAVQHKGPKCLVYHNITPAEFFAPYRPAIALELAQGRADLQKLMGDFSCVVGDSAYNVAELVILGFQVPQILPIAVDPSRWNIRADEELMRQLQDGVANILFVGRLAPNKRQEQLVEAFAQYLTLDANARLILIGVMTVMILTISL